MTPCPSCHSGESRVLGLATDRLFRTTDKEFELCECRSCEVVFLSPPPLPEELANYYPRGYWWQTTARSHGANPWRSLLEGYRRFMIRGQVRRIRRLAARISGNHRRLLDIGCGDGLFLAACRNGGWVRLGLDPSLDALASARARAVDGLAQGHADSLPFASDSLDVITMFHVLEHLPDPHQCLREVRRALGPAGLLVVQVPNAGSLQRYIFGRSWAGFDVPRHLVNYRVRNLRAVLSLNGFNPVEVTHLSLRDNPAIPVMSVFPRLYPPSRRTGPAGRRSLPAWVNSLLDLGYFFFVLLITPLALAESLMGRGGTFVVVAEKAGTAARS